MTTLLKAADNKNLLLWEGVFQGDSRQVSQALTEGAHPHTQESFGNIPLHYAVYFEDRNIFPLLLPKGGVFFSNSEGITPLEIAIRIQALSLLSELSNQIFQETSKALSSSHPEISQALSNLHPPRWINKTLSRQHSPEKHHREKKAVQTLEEWTLKHPTTKPQLEKILFLYEKAKTFRKEKIPSYTFQVGALSAQNYLALQKREKTFLITFPGKKTFSPEDPQAFEEALKQKTLEHFFYLLHQSSNPSIFHSRALQLPEGTNKTLILLFLAAAKEGKLSLSSLTAEEQVAALSHLFALRSSTLTIEGDLQSSTHIAPTLTSFTLQKGILSLPILHSLLKEAPTCHFTLLSKSLTPQEWYQIEPFHSRINISLKNGEILPYSSITLHDLIRAWERSLFFVFLSFIQNPNQCDERGTTPLHCLARRGQQEGAQEMVTALVLSKASLEIRDNNGKTPIDIAEQIHPPFAHFLKSLKDPHIQLQESKKIAPLWGNPQESQKKRPLFKNLSSKECLNLHSQGPFSLELSTGETLPIDLQNPTLLHQVIHARDTETFFFLLTLHPPINERDENGKTPLHLAAASGSKSPEQAKTFLSLLLFFGADPKALDQDKETPLQKAHKRHLTSIATYLNALEQDPLILLREADSLASHFPDPAAFQKIRTAFLQKHPLVAQFDALSLQKAQNRSTIHTLQQTLQNEMIHNLEELKSQVQTLQDHSDPLYQHYLEKTKITEEKNKLQANPGTKGYYSALEQELSAKFLGALAVQSSLVQREETSFEKKGKRAAQGAGIAANALIGAAAALTFGLSLPVGELLSAGIQWGIEQKIEAHAEKQVTAQRKALLSHGSNVKTLLERAELIARRATQKRQRTLTTLTQNQGELQGKQMAETLYTILSSGEINTNSLKTPEEKVTALLNKTNQ